MSTNILCHIVGLNEIMKESLKNEINDIDGVIVKDLDEITHKLRSDKSLTKLDNKIDKLKRKTDKNNCPINIINERKKYVTQYNKLWKDTMTNKLLNVCKLNKKNKIILLGLSTHHKNSRLRVNIFSKYKYLVTTKSYNSTKQIVEYNMDKYKKHIINGTFPLKYLDHVFLDKQKKSTEKIYKSFGYNTKTMTGIIKWIKLKVNHNPIISNNKHTEKVYNNSHDDDISTNNDINIAMEGGETNNMKLFYFGKAHENPDNNTKTSRKKIWLQDSHIEKMICNKSKSHPPIQEKYIAYDVEWLAILSALKNMNKYIKKGYFEYKNKKIPYIEERVENGFSKLDTELNIYTGYDLQFNKIGYKYIGFGVNLYKDSTKIYIRNAYDHLKNIGVKFIKYNNNNKHN